MSLLSDFLASAHAAFQSVAGTETLSIGGGADIPGTLGEASFSKDYEAGGFEQEGAVEFVTGRSQFVAAYPAAPRSYEGKSAIARGEAWRVARIHVSTNFVRVALTVPNKSS